MATEIERKFTVWPTPELQQLLATAESKKLLQGYLEPGVNTTVTVSLLESVEGTDEPAGLVDLVVTGAPGAHLNLQVHIPFDDAKEITELLCVDGVVVAEKNPTVRVRTTSRGTGVLTIKARGDGLSRPEFEYEIGFVAAQQIIHNFSQVKITKTRYVFPVEGTDLHWELDVFDGANTGLVIAEVELPTADTKFPEPAWLADDVTYQPEFANVNLAWHPFSTWSAASRSNVPDAGPLQGITREDAL